MHERNSSRSQPAGQENLVAGQLVEMVDQLQTELDELRDQLAWSNRMGQLGMLTAALAHETNNFLTPVRTYAQLALANPEDKSISERALRAAIEGTKKAEALTERVLGLAMPNQPIQTGICMADQAVLSAIQSLLPAIKQQGVHVLTHVEPLEVAIDALALEQVIINLVGNACQAMSGSTGRRQILIESEQDASNAVLTVGDNGPGVPTEIREQLFDAFVTRAQSSNTAGSGLGLNICKQLIESAGGRITLDSSSESGSTFKIELPAAQ
jgi:signal transduction histidine kinase